jgi:hypothetical protein
MISINVTRRLVPIGAELTDGAAPDSLPPCGGGMGWGVVQSGTDSPYFTTPTPIPSPQGGGEEFAALANLNLTSNCLDPRQAADCWVKPSNDVKWDVSTMCHECQR